MTMAEDDKRPSSAPHPSGNGHSVEDSAPEDEALRGAAEEFVEVSHKNRSLIIAAIHVRDAENQRRWGVATDAIRDLRADMVRRFDDADAVAVRRFAHVMTAHSTILARLDKSDDDKAAITAAVENVHRVASDARKDAEDLGAQVGKTASDLHVVAEETRGKLATLHDKDEVHDKAIARASRDAMIAKALSAVKIPVLMGAGAVLWKCFEYRDQILALLKLK